MAMNNSGRLSGRTQVQRQMKLAAVVLVVLVALGYAAVPLVDHAVSSPGPAAQVAPANRTPGAGVAQQGMENAAAAVGSLHSHLLNVGTERTDHARECQPEAGVDTACIFN